MILVSDMEHILMVFFIKMCYSYFSILSTVKFCLSELLDYLKIIALFGSFKEPKYKRNDSKTVFLYNTTILSGLIIRTLLYLLQPIISR